MKQIILFFLLWLNLVTFSMNEIKSTFPSIYQEKFLTGSDFFAVGTEPFWSLDIQLGNKFLFTFPDEKKEVFPFYDSYKVMDADITTFTGKDIKINVSRNQCSDGMSDTIYPYSVSIEKGENILTGCGLYLYDSRVHDIFVIEDVQGLPKELINRVIEFNPSNSSFLLEKDEDFGRAIFQGRELYLYSNGELRELNGEKIIYNFKKGKLTLKGSGNIEIKLKKDRLGGDMENRFDAVAKEWDKMDSRMELATRFSNYIRKNLEKKDSSLDFGCGTGNLDFLLKDEIEKLFLTDSSQGMLEVLKEKIERYDIQNFEIINTNLTEEVANFKFSNFFTSMVLHHIENTENFLKNIYNSLNNGGKIFICDLYKEDGTFHKDNSGIFHFGFDEMELRETFQKIGFQNFQIEEIFAFDRNEGKFPIFALCATKL